MYFLTISLQGKLPQELKNLAPSLIKAIQISDYCQKIACL